MQIALGSVVSDSVMPISRPRTFDLQRKWRATTNGLMLAMRDRAVLYRVVISAFALMLGAIQGSWAEQCVLLLVTALALSAELMNTAIEELCDYVEPDHAPQIGATKDIASAAVAMCDLAWLGVVAFDVLRLVPPALS